MEVCYHLYRFDAVIIPECMRVSHVDKYDNMCMLCAYVRFFLYVMLLHIMLCSHFGLFKFDTHTQRQQSRIAHVRISIIEVGAPVIYFFCFPFSLLLFFVLSTSSNYSLLCPCPISCCSGVYMPITGFLFFVCYC